MTSLIRPKTLAEQLGVTEGTLAKWRLFGTTGPSFIRVGRRIAYDPADVAAWLDARRVTSTSEVL
jgi:predicted DNA-binding transcriptional regulator AlpA